MRKGAFFFLHSIIFLNNTANPILLDDIKIQLDGQKEHEVLAYGQLGLRGQK